MKEDAFRAWMEAQGQAPNTVSTRLADARRVEKHYGELDLAYEDDGFAGILEDLAYTAADAAAGKANTSRIQTTGDPLTSLASYRSALSVYRQFRESEGNGGSASQAENIRSFVIKNYVEPARQQGLMQFKVRAGDVHRDMGLENAMPAVCGALDAKKFSRAAAVEQIGREGPANSSTVTFTFAFPENGTFGVQRAKVLLRDRYGTPNGNTDKMLSFALGDGRAIALQTDIAKVQLWLEDDGQSGAPPAQQVQHYGPEQGRHSNLPGRLRHNPPAELRAAGFPRSVLSVRAASETEFLRLLEWYEGSGSHLNRAALEHLKALFLARYPDFEPNAFRRTSGGYFDEERSYKDTLIAEAQSVLDRAGELSEEELGGSFLDLLVGPISGLLGWRTDARIKNLRKAHPGVLERATASLVRDNDEAPAAVEAFVEAVWPVLLEGQEKSRPFSETRNLPSMLLALAKPEEAFGINTDPFSRVAQAVIGTVPFGNSPLSAEEYGQVLHLARSIESVMRDEWGWAPRDLWDVQGFVWAVSRSDTPALYQNQHKGAAAVRPTNLILYGPPGTGKTYATAAEAVRLCDGSAPTDRAELLARYEALAGAGQIGFVTFHQSYAYEDFVEGLRPTTAPDADSTEHSSGGFRLEPRRGVFREISALAEQARKNAGRSGGFDLSGRQFFKMSLGRAGVEDHIYDAAIEGNYLVLGWGGEVDWSDAKYDNYDAIFERWNEEAPGTSGNSGNISQVWRFRGSMREGDIVIVSEGNSHFRAVAEVAGPYRYDPTGEQTYNHRREVRWLLVLDEPLPVETIYDGAFTMQSCYRLKEARIKREALSRLLPSDAPASPGTPDQFVLVIDEINRANISKVFGELITLIEADKRLGQPNALRLKLPYSGDNFGVPSNLHIVGTMNTADRSIALLDTALRRRFEFRELMPDAGLLPERVDGIPLRGLLQTLNSRIEYLFDREHQIGHAYFMGCANKDQIDAVMRDKVIPLLQEYFYEDWGKVALVLGDADGAGQFIERQPLAPPKGLSAEAGMEDRYRWSVKPAFDSSAYAQFA